MKDFYSYYGFSFLNSGIYAAMALVGKFICSFTGIDNTGGFELSLDAIVEGLGYAVPPIMALLFILDVCFHFKNLIFFFSLKFFLSFCFDNFHEFSGRGCEIISSCSCY